MNQTLSADEPNPGDRVPDKAGSADSAGTDAKPSGQAEKRDPAFDRAESFRIAGGRETVEAFVVAFILALLFRAFLAEAFVIPTGSMAPALMGAHKDVFCEQCDYRFPIGASRERSSGSTDVVVVGGVCPNCRRVNSLDLKNDRGHTTFNGDRILVNKFSYMFDQPDRWDVIVFKYPGNPKQNYIKRLVGLPGETLTIRHGDVYRTDNDRPNATADILRKPDNVLMAMSHPVSDSRYLPATLLAAGYPSAWQAWQLGVTSPPADSWQTEVTDDGLVAQVQTSDSETVHWLRYFHRVPDDSLWDAALAGESLSDVDPYAGHAVTDFYSYDSYISVPADYVYDLKAIRDRARRRRNPLVNLYEMVREFFGANPVGDAFNPEYESGGDPARFGNAASWGGQHQKGQQIGREGLHWVGDLIVDADIETSPEASDLWLEIVEAGVLYRCRIDLSDGSATLSIDDDGQPRPFDGAAEADDASPRAETAIRAGKTHSIRFSNCDDELRMHVDGDRVRFDRPTTFDARSFRSRTEDRPHFRDDHPLDAAPVAIGVRGGSAEATNLVLRRDKYYIATQESTFGGGIFDYAKNEMWQLAGRGISNGEIQELFGRPDLWDEIPVWQTRRSVSFQLEDEQYFPMGDNSPESLDARCWANSKRKIRLPRRINEDAWRWSDRAYVPRELLVGKAVVVFWPHSWNSPLPMTPNVERMGVIE